jgi:hypothetical protein
MSTFRHPGNRNDTLSKTCSTITRVISSDVQKDKPQTAELRKITDDKIIRRG